MLHALMRNMETGMGAGRPKVELILSDAEQDQLSVWSRRRKTAQALALRSRIVLACARGAENKMVAVELKIAKQMVCKWRGRFIRTVRLRPIKSALP
jgi:FixJ family two-component response regulator